MTVTSLAKILNRIVSEGKGRASVVVVKDTLDDGNGTYDCCEVHKADVNRINVADGDGFTVENKDGSERLKLVLVLRGRWFDS